MSAASQVRFVYDSGALIAIGDRRDPTASERHDRRMGRGLKIFVPAVVVAQVVRKPATQARLMLALKGCSLVPFTEHHHVPVGELLAASGTADVIDAFVALLAAREQASVVSSDPDDMRRLLSCLGVRRAVLQA
jgi:predicted nucleic acid-binding protein